MPLERVSESSQDSMWWTVRVFCSVGPILRPIPWGILLILSSNKIFVGGRSAPMVFFVLGCLSMSAQCYDSRRVLEKTVELTKN